MVELALTYLSGVVSLILDTDFMLIIGLAFVVTVIGFIKNMY